ncbi:Lrp/AsnC family transcriptional regulator [Acidovorax sp. D2M1]|uniref:siroheme decarboxylase n=1 Tax=Acidovorax benzenivorans TaxID=2987520 RepID=A0ABT5RV90_9BURK|nr:Lrp/AsnC family transcriptional regulator [Acidovorax benzenivorans]MDD2177617.1 Lrp/AsnC family transcriptional regulator [Acidovorax benzenivorans]
MARHDHAHDLPLLNAWQRGFPLCPAPFDVLGQALGRPAGEVIAACERLQRAGVLGRIGGVFAPGAGGAGLLAAMAVPRERLEAVAAAVSRHAGVSHNYERENTLNLWFVANAATPAALEQLLAQIERDTGLAVLRLPMLRPYRIDLGFDLGQRSAAAGGMTRTAATPVAAHEAALAALAEHGLPLVERPFDAWAEALGQRTEDVLGTLSRWLAQGTLSRFGMVVRHHEVGYTANAMTVFDVPDDEVDACGERLACQPGITLAYRRARAGRWGYNLYCMVHGQERGEVLALVEQAALQAGVARHRHEVLFSLRRFTQRGPRRFAAAHPTPPEAPRHA